MNVNDIPKNKGIEAMKAASRIAEESGISDMSLDDINKEIKHEKTENNNNLFDDERINLKSEKED